MAAEVISLQIDAILNGYMTDMQRGLKLGVQFDLMLDDIVTDANRASKALGNLSNKFTLAIDTSALDRVMSEARALDGMTPDLLITATSPDLNSLTAEMTAIDTATPDVTVTAASPDLQAIGQSVQMLDRATPDVTVTAKDSDLNRTLDTVADIDASAPDVHVKSLDSEINLTQRKIDGMDGQTVNVRITADDGAITNVKNELDDLEKLAKIDLVLNIAQAAGGGLRGLAGAAANLPIISDIAQIDSALDTLRAKTGKDIPEAANIIENVYSQAWGESYDEIAQVLGAVAQVSDGTSNLEDDIVSVFETATVTGYDFAETIAAQSQLVRNGLAPDFEAAGDIITRGYQLGGDRAQDLLDTLREYAPVFAAAGIDGKGAIKLITDALNEGSFNADKVGDSFKELGIIIQDTLKAGEGEQFDVLKNLGMVDEAELFASGEMSGTQFAEAFNTAVQAQLDAGTIDPAEARTAFTSVFGTPLEDLGVDVFRGIDFSEPSAEFTASFDDASTIAADHMNDNLGTAVTEFTRTLELEVVNSLEAAGLKIDDLLQGVIDKAKEIAKLIRSGVGIPEALEIALEAPGLANTIRRAESVFGNFVLEILTGLANVVDTLPGGDASGIRETIADFGGRQLAFDLALDPENLTHIENTIQAALRRGVDPAELAEQVARTGQDLINRDDLAAAQGLLNTLQEAEPVQVTFEAAEKFTGAYPETITIPVDIDPDSTKEQIDAAAEQAKNAWLESNNKVPVISMFEGPFDVDIKPTVDTSALQGLVAGAMSDAGVTIEGEIDNALGALDEFFGIVREREPIIPENETVAMAASALSIDSIAHALEAVKLAGWPITEADLQALADSESDYETLVSKLNDYQRGIEDAGGTAEETFEAIRLTGIDPTIAETELLNQETGAYVLGLVDTLEKSKVTWEDYKLYLATLELPTPEGGIPAGLVPEQTRAIGGSTEPGMPTLFGELGPELGTLDQRHIIINASATGVILDALATVLSGGYFGGGGGDTYNTQLNFTQNVYPASGAAGAGASNQLARTAQGYATL